MSILSECNVKGNSEMTDNHRAKSTLVIKQSWGGRHYEVIDFLKGWSITTIVLMHLLQGHITLFPQVIMTAASLGGSGVHVFIFCSGFGLYLSQLNQQKSFKEFIKKRIQKVYLPYIVVVFVSFLIPYMYSDSDRIVALLSHVLLFKMFFQRFECSFGVQFWFISTIIQFYLAFIPLCHLRKKLKRLRSFALFGVLVSAIYWIFMAVSGLGSIRIWGSFFLQYLWEFCLGMCVAEWVHKGHALKLSVHLLLFTAFVGLGMEMALGLSGGIFRIFNDIPSLLGYGALAILIYQLGFINRWILFIASFSYEWFLVHNMVFAMAFQLETNTLFEQCAVGICAFVLSILVAWFYSKLWGKAGV